MVDQVKADALAKELGFSGYGGRFKVGKHEMVMTCDGVGTKVLVAETLGKYDTVGIDLVAMCANDLLCCGARPEYFMDYYATGDLDIDKSRQILKGIKRGCEIANAELMGGETAQLNPMFLHNDWFDLAGFMVGEVCMPFDEEPIKVGDYLVGIPSSGVHSNGFTDLREAYLPNLNRWSLAEHEWLLEPTRIYTREIMANMDDIKSCAHITGGGLHGNIPRATNGFNYELDMRFNEYWAGIEWTLGYERGQMLNTFNCGYGMVMVVSDPTRLHTKDSVVIGRITS